MLLLLAAYAILVAGIVSLRPIARRGLWWSLLALLLFALLTYGLVTCGLLWQMAKGFSFVFLIVIAAIMAIWLNSRLKKQADYP
ncbi:hypothetical protein [Candidatus Entotheonella palauensis]|uniref:hypothetical protein n=1 Tax=Candidatus Entotheonella palauensis TaxID=93172 RepID=UPI0011773D01|nr:hypothetical protein [Candidatus Entotheonella palauensis]